ncbi:sarcoplasmic calcium-binding protein [Aplysia californica]|uniref:Sarcoplasmic calcium-binding protein n=1 Tax=Aplysia californica TaxID=6500 RepID=A0ABM0ZZE7_APLCA|nr:sarcoplasmic calcium-binding protein [Aplysia californica]
MDEQRSLEENTAFSSFVEGKIKWWFDLIDVDNDGYISKDDFLIIAIRFVKEHGMEEEKAVMLKRQLVKAWERALLKPQLFSEDDQNPEMREDVPLIIKVGEELEAGHHIPKDDFSRAFGQLINYNSLLARNILETLVNVFFDMFDKDDDGFISPQELEVFMRCLGTDQAEMAQLALSCLDTDRDGKLSREEYVGGWCEFLLSQQLDHQFITAFAPHFS